MFVLLFERCTGRSMFVLPETVTGVLPHEYDDACYVQRLVGNAESTHAIQGTPESIMERLGIAWSDKAETEKPRIVINPKKAEEV